jgi:hypothetical protein
MKSSVKRAWVLGTVAGVAVLAMVTGGVQMVQLASAISPAGASPEPEPQVPDLPPGKQGRKSPGAFGLPVYPGAFDFHSMESTKEIGSASFSIKRGTADDVVQFYMLELGSKGWVFQWQRPATETPGPKGGSLVFQGARARWTSADSARQLTLLALNDPGKDRTSQAVLSWAPSGSVKR